MWRLLGLSSGGLFSLGFHEAVSSILIQIYRTVFKRVWLEFSLIKSIFSFEIQTQDKSLRNNSMTFVSWHRFMLPCLNALGRGLFFLHWCIIIHFLSKDNFTLMSEWSLSCSSLFLYRNWKQVSASNHQINQLKLLRCSRKAYISFSNSSYKWSNFKP